LEYENFNDGNTWLLQGASGQYGWNLKEQSGLGLYAFTTRTASSNELDLVDRLLSGGRFEYVLNGNMKFGLNEVAMYDLSVASASYDYWNNVTTGDFRYNRETEGAVVKFNAEFGGSQFSYTRNVDTTTQEYTDMVVDIDMTYGLKKSGIVIGADFRRVGATFFSPTAQSRRYIANGNPLLFNEVSGTTRGQQYFDQFTDEDVYSNSITPALMAFNQYYNNLSPYGDATPNRIVYGVEVATDTSVANYEAKAEFDYGTEIVGEGGEDLRSFMVINAGGLIKLGNLLNTNRQINVSAGVRYENTSRNDGAPVYLTSTLLDVGLSAEVIKKIDLLAGMKYFGANGNEFIATRDGFNLVTDFDALDVDVNETIFSFGARIRFSKKQVFNLNYNVSQFVDNSAQEGGLNIGQLFFNYTGKF
jgi:hypothetical protein